MPATTLSARAGETVVLGIETSCDETAAAVIARNAAGRGRILSNVVRSQWDQHRLYGGVVPEIAARAHVECLDAIIREAMARVRLDALDAVAVTAGPGLIGGLLVGLTTAKAIALARNIPLVAVNHLEAHALTVGLTDGLAPPYAVLLVSGGHTQLQYVRGVGDYKRLSTTIDDSLGEAFDKVAKLLGLGLPGGPAVEKAASSGDATRFSLPRPMLGRVDANFSFAGLKTAVRRQATKLAPLGPQDVSDLCAAFEVAATEAVVDRVRVGLRALRETHGVAPLLDLVVAGGVAANVRLKSGLASFQAADGYRLVVPPPDLCTDNGAMIAWAGAERLALGLVDMLDVAARARWPLDAAAVPAIGSGRLGAKA